MSTSDPNMLVSWTLNTDAYGYQDGFTVQPAFSAQEATTQQAIQVQSGDQTGFYQYTNQNGTLIAQNYDDAMAQADNPSFYQRPNGTWGLNDPWVPESKDYQQQIDELLLSTEYEFKNNDAYEIAQAMYLLTARELNKLAILMKLLQEQQAEFKALVNNTSLGWFDWLETERE